MATAAAHRLDATLLALAHPTRRAIIHRLTRGEARVTTLARPFRMSLNAVSKHILVLERARLVKRRRHGREHVLSLNVAPLQQATAWMNDQRLQWETRLAMLDALLTQQATTRENP